MTKRGQAGFTIIEVLIAAVVLGVLLAGVGSYMFTSHRTQEATSLSLDLNSATETLGKYLIDAKPTSGKQGWIVLTATGMRVDPEKGPLPGEKRYEYGYSLTEQPGVDEVTLYLSMWDRTDRSMTNYSVFTFTR